MAYRTNTLDPGRDINAKKKRKPEQVKMCYSRACINMNMIITF